MNRIGLLILLASPLVAAQTPQKAEAPGVAPRALELTETIAPETDLGSVLLSPFRCDGDSNLYYRKSSASPWKMPIEKYDARGQLKASFNITEAGVQDLMPLSFFVSKKGEVFQAGGIRGGHDAYVVAYSSDGHVTSKTKLDLKDASIYNFAVFPTGEMLLGGIEHSRGPDNVDMSHAFTIIADRSGKTLKKMELEDDRRIKEAFDTGDPVVAPAGTNGINMAVAGGHVGVAEDGNVYLLRRLNPAIIYGISPAGEIVRRIELKSDVRDSVPRNMLINGTDAAVLFGTDGPQDTEIRIVDLTNGDLKAVYKPAQSLGTALTCFNSSNFTFLGAKEGRRVIYRAAMHP